jgi:hypothetical protein
MSDVFRLQVTDQTNRCPVFIDIPDDPQRHERDRANAMVQSADLRRSQCSQ